MMLLIPSLLLTSYGLFWGIQLNCWPFWAFHSSVDFALHFGCFWLEKLIRISSWLKQYLGGRNQFNSWLKQPSRNWLRINSWLSGFHRYWFISNHDSKCFPVSIQINSWHKRRSFNSESTHGSTSSHTMSAIQWCSLSAGSARDQ